MKKIYLFLAAMASVALVGCTSDLLVADTPSQPVDDEEGSAIIFSSLSKATTRADFVGVDAATKLGKQFVVSGYKGASSAWNATSSSIAFDNYAVEYRENTAHTTESNVANWEYVGVNRIQHAINNGITSQTIKYWDYTKPQYDFIAWSTGLKTPIYSGVPAAGEVLVSAITPQTATGTGAGKVAYTFEGSVDDLAECYVADLVTVKKANYGQPVTLSFRQLGTKVRIGIYETVPGYSVRDVKFYQTAGLLTDPTTEITTTPALFTATTGDVYTNGRYTVTFPTVDNTSSADNNQAHVEFYGIGAQSTVVEWGGLNYTTREEGEKNTGSVYLGRSSNDASFAGSAAKNYYEVFLPNESGTNLNLRVDFTLESIDGGGEVIEVKNAQAQVPSIYTQWKPGFAYTYLFKISDKTNGRTGVYDPTKSDDDPYNSDPAGLYPITFDAVVVNAEDNDQTQETITTVMTPSITTYQQKSTVVNADEYTVNGKDIFVTVNEGDALVTLTGKAALYTIPEGKTEADVIDALQIQDDFPGAGVTIKGRNGMELKAATLVATAADIDAANKYALTNSVEFGADGNAIGVGTDQSLRFRPAAPVSPATVTTYAFVYTKTAPTGAGTDKYEAVTVAVGDDVTKLYRNFNLTAVTGDAKAGSVYMSKDGSGVLTTETVFAGQLVNTLYTRTGEGTTTDPYVYHYAAGNAKTGTTYYYTTDGGVTYNAAANIAFAGFATATDLYTFDGTYTLKTDVAPQAGTAYYQKTTSGGVDTYTYCVILPEQVDGLYRYQFDAAGRYACLSGEKAIAGHGYFDKYTMNNGVYYTKVIKVQ